MLRHLGELILSAAGVGGAVYFYKRKKGMPAPPVAPVVPSSPSSPVTPVSPSSPSSPPILVTPPSNAAPTSLSGGVIDTVSNGIDVLTGGMIGQDVSGGLDTAGSGGSLGDTSTLSTDALSSDVSDAASSVSDTGSSIGDALDSAASALGISL